MSRVAATLEVIASAVTALSFFAAPVALLAVPMNPFDYELPPPPDERAVVYWESIPPLEPTPPQVEDAPQEEEEGPVALVGPASTDTPVQIASNAVQEVAAAPPPPPEERVRQRRNQKVECLPPLDGIEALSDNSYRIDRQLFNSYARDLKQAETLTAAWWHRDGAGEVDGFKLGRVRCDNPLYQVGLRSRDVIHTMDGRVVNDMPAALLAWRRVLRHDTLVVTVTRHDGSELVLNYDISKESAEPERRERVLGRLRRART